MSTFLGTSACNFPVFLPRSSSFRLWKKYSSLNIKKFNIRWLAGAAPKLDFQMGLNSLPSPNLKNSCAE